MALDNIVVLTGGTRRVGLFTARALQQAGYQVLVTYRQQQPIITELQNEGIAVAYADFSSPEGTQRFINQLQQRVSSVRAIIHNASCWVDDQQPVVAMEQSWQCHVMAPYLINQQCAPLLRANKGMADIIHITDYVAEAGSRHHIAYAASKAALNNMMVSFAKTLAPDIKVNSIAPSLLMFHENDTPDYRQQTLAKSALGIEPGPRVLAETVAYLLDNPYITGRCLALDGGRNVK